MSQKVVATGPTPLVEIDAVHGDLQLKGWERQEVLVKSSPGDDPVVEMQADGLHITCHGDCLVRVPEDARLQVRSVNGNARFKMLEGNLKIDLVSGSLEMRDVSSTQVGKVYGNLLARHIDGDLQVEQVNGNTIARDVQGACSIAQVGGNLKLRDAEGSVNVTAGGNAKIQLMLLTGDHYTIHAGGNIHCTVPEDAGLQVDLQSSAHNIKVRLPGEASTRYDEDCHLSLGSGAPMKISAGGSILFACQEMDWSDMEELQSEFDDTFTGFAEEFGQNFVDQIEDQVQTQMKVLGEQMENLSHVIGREGLSAADKERILEQARHASERASQHAQEKIRRAQEKMARKLAAAQRKAELRKSAQDRRSQGEHRRTWNYEWSASPTPPTPNAAVGDEERLVILRMLEQKKITLEQAESLLAALENS